MLRRRREPICLLGDDVLRQLARPVTDFGAEIHELAERLLRAVKARKAVGVAANQIGASLRVLWSMSVKFAAVANRSCTSTL